jgi:hypothetical protein
MYAFQLSRHFAGLLAAKPCVGAVGLLALLLPGTG